MTLAERSGTSLVLVVSALLMTTTHARAQPGHREFTVWFERVYVRRDGRWLYVSHRTVNDPSYVD
jgi:hypothetical protein